VKRKKAEEDASAFIAKAIEKDIRIAVDATRSAFEKWARTKDVATT